MAKPLEEQYADLQRAYRRLEQVGNEQAVALRRGQRARAALALVLGMFLGAGMWSWWGSAWPHLPGLPGSTPASAGIGGSPEPRTAVVEPRELESTVSLMGRLTPWRTVRVSSPADGHVKAIAFDYGRHVAEGQRLLELDLDDIRLKHQESRLEYEKARKALREVRNWERGPEVASALRTFAKAKMALEDQQAELETSSFLLEQGLIPASDHEHQKRQYMNQLLDFDAAAQDLVAVRAKGGPEAIRVAEIEFKKARNQLRVDEERLGMDSISAPIAGTILAPTDREPAVIPGRAVKEGEVLLTIADHQRLSVVAPVDEMEVTKIDAGQRVAVTGDAFRGLELQGTVSGVSAHPVRDRLSRTPRFEVTVTLDALDETAGKRLRAGMSSRLDVTVYHNPAALMVPIDALEKRDGRGWVRVLDRATGEVRDREVEVGLTTLRSAEVTRGLEAGEMIVLPGT